MIIEGWAALWGDYGECKADDYRRVPITIEVTEYGDGIFDAVNKSEINFAEFNANYTALSLMVFDAPTGGVPVRINNHTPLPEMPLFPSLVACKL